MIFCRPILALPLALFVPAGAAAQSVTGLSCSYAAQTAIPGSVSDDGRYATFCVEDTVTIYPSWGPNSLILTDTFAPGAPNTVVASSSQANWHAPSWSPCATPDSAFVVFTDSVSHSPADTNTRPDVYLYDRVAGTYELISVNANGAAGNAASVTPGSISDNGRYVVFSTMATDIVPQNTAGFMEVAVRDRVTGTTTRVSGTSTGVPNNGHSYAGVISGDGRFVAFESLSYSLLPGDPGPWSDVFLRDLVAGTTVCLSVGPSGSFGNGDSGSSAHSPVPPILNGVSYDIPVPPAISSDGRFVAFASKATNLVSTPSYGYYKIFVRDTVTGTTMLVSDRPDGTHPSEDCYGPSISGDGRFVGFASRAVDLAPTPPHGYSQCYLHDRLWSQTEVASADASGLAQGGSAPSMELSRNGRFELIAAQGYNTMAPFCGLSTNDRVYLRDRGLTLQRSFCPDGAAGSASPCGQPLPPYPSLAGCAQHLGGAGTLTATGDASLSADTLVLHGAHMTNTSVLYFQGSTMQQGGIGTPFGDGVRCVAGQIRRLGTKINASGASTFPAQGDPSISVKGQITVPGSLYYQAWFRDAAPGFCTTATFNMTNAREIVWVP